MGIKHADVKTTGQKGYATEWNKNHIIDDDVDWNAKKITNMAEPAAASDAATKGYVDTVTGGLLQATSANKTTASSTDSSSLIDVPGLSATLTTTAGKVLVLCCGEGAGLDIGSELRVRLIRDSTPDPIGEVIVHGTAAAASQHGTINCMWYEVVEAGSHTWKLQYRSAAGGNVRVYHSKLIVMELK